MNQPPNEQSPGRDTASIEFICSSCSTRLRIPLEYAGKSVRCPKCQATSVADSPLQSANPILTHNRSTVEASANSTGSAPSESNRSVVNQPNEPLLRSPTLDPRAEYGQDTAARQLYRRITHEISKIFVGQDELVMGTLVALFSGGHVLIESVPGLGKTLFVRTLGKVLGCDFGRIQFTADLMPSDVTGSPIFNMKTLEFNFRKGPVFTQLLLADEINRAPAKTHAALLEIMQEKNVTIDGVTHQLDLPFMVLATQNPIESEGTYNLPEAQLDRFLFKILATYPTEAQESEILMLHSGQKELNVRLQDEIEVVTNAEEIRHVTRQNEIVRVDPKLVNYINQMVRLTRQWPAFHIGASPRAGISLMQGARTLAAFCGRDFAVPDDVVQLAIPALRHRVALTAEAEVEGQQVDQLLQELIRSIPVPRLD